MKGDYLSGLARELFRAVWKGWLNPPLAALLLRDAARARAGIAGIRAEVLA